MRAALYRSLARLPLSIFSRQYAQEFHVGPLPKTKRPMSSQEATPEVLCQLLNAKFGIGVTEQHVPREG